MLGWFSSEDDVGQLIARKKYAKAAKLLREQLAGRRQDVHLRQRLADVLVLDGDQLGALRILGKMVDEFAESGFDAKAIAVLKKMQRIDPERTEIEERLARLINRRDRQMQRDTPQPARLESADTDSLDSSTFDIDGIDGIDIDGPGAKLPAMQTSPLFATFTAEELLAVIRGLTLLTYDPGEIIVSESQPGDSLFVVAAGEVRVYVRNAVHENIQIRTLRQGDFFGEISLLTGKARTATITAAAPTELLQLDRHTLDDIAVQHPQLPQTIREFCDRRALSPEEIRARGGLDAMLGMDRG